MNNLFFRKTMENVRKDRHIRLVTTCKRKSYLVSEPNYHTTKWFSENLLEMEMNKIRVKIERLIYLSLPILDIRKAIMYEFWYDYINQNMVIKRIHVRWIHIDTL